MNERNIYIYFWHRYPSQLTVTDWDDTPLSVGSEGGGAGGQNDDDETKWQMNSASFSLKRPTALLKPETQRGVSIFSRGHSVKRHMWLAEEQMSGQRENKSFHKEQRVGGASNWVNHLRVKDVTSPSSTHTQACWRVAVKDKHRPLVLFALTLTLTIQPVVDWRKNLEEQCSRSNLGLINGVSPWSSNLHCPFALFNSILIWSRLISPSANNRASFCYQTMQMIKKQMSFLKK